MKMESFVRLDGVIGDASGPRYKGWFVVPSFRLGTSGSMLDVLYGAQFSKLDDAVRCGRLSSGQLDVLHDGVVTVRVHLTGIIDARLFLKGGTPMIGNLRLDCTTKGEYTASAPKKPTSVWKTTEPGRR
jgi:hypothetical protein